MESLSIVASGEIGIERFYGQTLVYLPKIIGDRVGRFSITRIALEVFSSEKLRKAGYTCVKVELQ